MPMLFQKGLLDALSRHVSQHNLLTPSQGACLGGRQPFDTVYTFLSYIQHRHEHLRQPTYVFFGDISLAFPSVFREQLLLRLHSYGIPNDIWQHLRALHHSIRIRVLHGHNAPTSYLNILKGLTEGGRLCPLLWGLYIADLVTTLQRSFPHISLPPPDLAFFIGILLFVDDFALIASSPAELLALMQLTQSWCEDNRLLLAHEKCKVIVFHETPHQRRQRERAGLPWQIISAFPSRTIHPIQEVDTFHYLGTTLDSRTTFDPLCKLIQQRIWHAHHKLAVARTCPRSLLRSGPATTIYRLWQSSVAIHALMHLPALHSPRHLEQLQITLNKSLAYTFRISLTAVPYLCVDLGFPPLRLQAAVALARLHCRLHHLPPTTLAPRLFRLRTSYPPSPSSLEAAIQRAHSTLLQPHQWSINVY